MNLSKVPKLKGKPMNVQTAKLSSIVILCFLAFAVTAGTCSAQGWSRKGKSEIFGAIQGMSSDTGEYSFPERFPVRFDMDSTTVYGIGYGYNFSDHWNLNTDLLFGTADTDIQTISNARFVTIESKDMDYVLWDVNVDYNFLKGRLTPLVTGGIGLVNFSIVTTSAVGEVHESDFSYNLGAGVRWDATDNIFLKLIYRTTWTELDGADNDQRYDGVNFSVAYMF
jgi:opacity protein-like surface antigen